MSKKYPGGIIRGTPVVPTTSTAPGIWTVCQAQNYTRQGLWPRSPGAPTIGTATDAATGGAVSVAFTAPSCTGSATITGYTAISTPGCITGTGASSPVTVSGLTNGTSYTFVPPMVLALAQPVGHQIQFPRQRPLFLKLCTVLPARILGLRQQAFHRYL